MAKAPTVTCNNHGAVSVTLGISGHDGKKFLKKKQNSEQPVHNFAMQLYLMVVKKQRLLDTRRLFDLEQLSFTEMSEYGRSIAAIGKPKLYYLTGAYVGFHVLEAPTYGTAYMNFPFQSPCVKKREIFQSKHFTGIIFWFLTEAIRVGNPWNEQLWN